jgi:hypothetical protein
LVRLVTTRRLAAVADLCPEGGYKVVCPLAAHTDRNAKISAYGLLHCSRHTGSGYWGAVDVLMRRFGFQDEDAAVAELSRIEDEQLAGSSRGVWSA